MPFISGIFHKKGKGLFFRLFQKTSGSEKVPWKFLKALPEGAERIRRVGTAAENCWNPPGRKKKGAGKRFLTQTLPEIIRKTETEAGRILRTTIIKKRSEKTVRQKNTRMTSRRIRMRQRHWQSCRRRRKYLRLFSSSAWKTAGWKARELYRRFLWPVESRKAQRFICTESARTEPKRILRKF